MKAEQLAKLLLASAVILATAACGGGGSGVASTPTPPSTSTPTPTPTPTPSPSPTPTPTGVSAVQIFPALNSSTSFAAIGLQQPRVGSGEPVSNASVSVRYDASSGLYLMAFPDAAEAPFYKFDANTPSDTWWGGETLESNGNAPATVNVLKPTNPIRQFSYTTLAYFDTGGMGGGATGWMAFGIPTNAGAVPTSGSATYSALVRGSTTDGAGYVQGNATLLFDFLTASLSGHFDPSYLDWGGGTVSLGRYDFINTVYGSGSTTFSGQLSQAGLGGSGSFNGQFTGPAAQELMATWSAPYLNPESHKVSTMFGVWVGSK